MSGSPWIFVSYRRSDSEYVADRIYERLEDHFGEGSVFFDIDTIPLGRDFRTHIDESVSQCAVAVVIIGTTWVSVTDTSGSRRLDSATDLVRLEVEAALTRDIAVIPVLVGGAEIPQPSELPSSLESLSYRNGLKVRSGRDFHKDVDDLIEGIVSLQLTSSSPKFSKDKLQRFSFEVITVDSCGQETDRRTESADHFLEVLGDGVFLDMVRIPGGEFLMGSPQNELQRDASEGPQHCVIVPEFFMGRYPVTQDQWRVVAGLEPVNRKLMAAPSRFKGASCPVERVSWAEAAEFCDRISLLSVYQYALPNEAEWEYACRAGSITPFYFGETITTDLANYRGADTQYESGSYGAGPKGEYRNQTTEVGQFPPNSFGLSDMHGNVAEWCQDVWYPNYTGAPTDGSAWQSKNDNSSQRVQRGGSWGTYPGNCRSSYRLNTKPGAQCGLSGFRVVCSSPRK